MSLGVSVGLIVSVFLLGGILIGILPGKKCSACEHFGRSCYTAHEREQLQQQDVTLNNRIKELTAVQQGLLDSLGEPMPADVYENVLLELERVTIELARAKDRAFRFG